MGMAIDPVALNAAVQSAIAEVREGHCARIAVPGQFKVWHDPADGVGVHIQLSPAARAALHVELHR